MSSKFLNGIDMSGTPIDNIPDAVSAQQPVSKAQLDAALLGLRWKDPARAASTANLTLSGAQTIDGVSVIAGDRVLVKNQSTASGNGIYVAASGAWARSTDADSSAELVNAAVFVSEGTANADTLYQQTANSPITIGTTSITWVQIGAGTSYTQSTAGVPYVDVNTSEALTAGNWVNLYLVSTTLTARKANATDDTKPCDGYVLAATSSGATARIYLDGINTELSSLTIGDVFLSTTAGATTSTGPSGSGNNWQPIGRAITATSVKFIRGQPIKRA